MARRNRRGRNVHGILLLDKPAGGSSNHFLQKVKRLYGAKKAGHTGSLDPLATGMLPICFGEATKLSGYLLDADKGYEVTLKLGVTTDSADADGAIEQTRNIPDDLDLMSFSKICESFLGAQQQIPPMVSAIKIDGQRLYKLARQGKKVDRPPRSVLIHSLDVLAFSGDSARLALRVSKGTYVRSLVTDIGEAIGCGAHVTALRRTYVSPFEQYRMLSIQTLEQLLSEVPSEVPADDKDNVETSSLSSQSLMWPVLDALLLPVDAGLSHLSGVTLSSAQALVFVNGGNAQCDGDSLTPSSDDALCCVYDQSSQLLGLGEYDQIGRQVAPRRVLQWD